MLRHRIVWAAAVALCVTVGVALASPPVTVVLTNGERYSGSIVAQRLDRIFIETNGRPRSFSVDQVAVIEFSPGPPDRRELAELASMADQFTGGRTAALQLQDGRLIAGRFNGMSDDGDSIRLYESRRGGQTFRVSEVARLYLNPRAAQDLYASNGYDDRSGRDNRYGNRYGYGYDNETGTSGQAMSGGTFRVDARQPWTPTSVFVRQGDRLAFQASGRVHWGLGPQQVSSPAGVPLDQKLQQGYPVPSIGVGALIGRVDNGQPFAIGDGPDPIIMPADGQLSLAVNDNERGDNSGYFQVRIVRFPGR